VEESHGEHRVEVVVGERQSPGVSAHKLEMVGDARVAGLLSALLEHRTRDVEADDVGPALGQHDREPAGPAGDFEDVLVGDRSDGVEDGALLATVDESPAARSRRYSTRSVPSRTGTCSKSPVEPVGSR
jgi:hypothetical protein